MSVYQATLLGQFADQACQNVFMFYHPAMTPVIITNTMTNLLVSFDSNVVPWLADDYVLDSYSLRRVDEPGYPETVISLGTPIVGEKPDDITPTQAAVCVSLYTGTLAPNRGRKYIGGFAEGGTLGSKWIAAVQSGVSNWINSVKNAYITDPDIMAQWVIGRLNREGEGETPPGTYIAHWNPVYSFIVRDVISTLGRRKIGRGL